MDWEYLLFILLGYFSGSVLYARLLPRLLKGVDVTRQSGDGNPGTANAIQLAGWPVGLLSLGLELAKGAAPVFLAARHLDMSQTAFALVLAAPALGHAFPFGRFTKGGKAIAVSFGCLLGLLPLWQPLALLAGLYIFFSVVLVVSPHLFRSVLVFGLLAAGCFLLKLPAPVTLGCCLLSALVILRHLLRYQGEKPAVRLFKKA